MPRVFRCPLWLTRAADQYRLCPGGEELTEQCFQKYPLAFDRSKQTLVWNNGTRLGIEGVFVDEGTVPKGSTWARNPIPRVNDDNRGNADWASCKGPNGASGPGCIQFPQPCNGTERFSWSTDGSGQGECSGDWTQGSIEDTVLIPADLAPGKWVLGWRWDCEETAQGKHCRPASAESPLTRIRSVAELRGRPNRVDAAATAAKITLIATVTSASPAR